MIHKRIIVVLVSLSTALILISTGYSLWEQKLVIRGQISISRPEYVDIIIPLDSQATVVDDVYQETLPAVLDDVEKINFTVETKVYQDELPHISIELDKTN